jgi:hypothetical protein
MNATEIVEEIDREIARLEQAKRLLGGSEHTVRAAKGRGKMSAEGRARVAAAQRARWAKVKRSKKA